MSDNDNNKKSIGYENFSDPKWIQLFSDYPEYKELLEKDKKLTEQLEPYPDWAEAFAKDRRWLEYLNKDTVVAFFKLQPAKFWSEQGWFDRIVKKKSKDQIQEWVKQFLEPGEFYTKFKDNPEWTLLYALEQKAQALPKTIKEKLPNHFVFHTKWIEIFFNDLRWLEFLDNDIEVAKFFSSQSVKFWTEQGWFDRIDKKIPKNQIQEWIKQFQGDDGKFTEFEKKPPWVLLYALEPKVKAFFEKNKNLTDFFETYPEWAELFASNTRWFEYLDKDEVIAFFQLQPAKFWGEQGWFDRIAKKKSKDQIQEWIKQFQGNGELSELFKNSPEWALLYALEPKAKALFENNTELATKFKFDPHWAEAFASDPRWFEFFDNEKKTEVANFLQQQPANFWSEQGWFDRFVNKLTINNIEINGDKFSDWLKQFSNEKSLESFKNAPKSYLLYSFIKYEKVYDDFKSTEHVVDETAINNFIEEFKNEKYYEFKDKENIAELFFNFPEFFILMTGEKDIVGFFKSHQNLAKSIFPFSKWIREFRVNKIESDFLEKAKDLVAKLKEDNKWVESLNKYPDFLKLFGRNPDIFVKKEAWFKKIEGKLKASDELKALEARLWVNQLISNEQWLETFDKTPEWALAHAFELELINDRRKKTIHNNENLVGLAFSGGGIRSASFSLGVLEALRDFGVLKKIDYLSTVSGGGYIGAWLSANCKRTAENNESEWLAPGEIGGDKKQLKKNWDDSISHLRRYSNYLSPRVGFFSADSWTMGIIWLRNTLLIQLTIILGIACILLVPRALFAIWMLIPEANYLPYIDKVIEINWRWMLTFLFTVAFSGVAFNSKRLIKKGRMESLPLPVGFIVFLTSAILISNIFNFHPFKNNYIGSLEDFILAAVVAFLCALTTLYFLVFIIPFIKIVFNSKIPIDYSQGEVQKLVVLPMMLFVFFVAEILWEESQLYPMCILNTLGELFTQAWKCWPFELTVVIVSLIILSFLSISRKSNLQDDNEEKSPTEKLKIQNKENVLQKVNRIKSLLSLLLSLFIKLLFPLPAMLVLYTLLSSIILLLHEWVALGEEGKFRAFVWAPPLILIAFSFAVVILIGILGNRSTEDVREWWSRMAAWLAIYGFAWMTIVAVAVYGPLWGAILYYDEPWKVLASGWIGTTLAGLIAGKSASTSGTDGKGIVAILKEAIAKLAPFVFIPGLLIVVSMILHLVIASNSDDKFTISRINLLGEIEQPSKQLDLQFDAKSDVHIDVRASKANISKPAADVPSTGYDKHWKLLSSANLTVIGYAFIVCFLCLLVLAGRVDINEFSFNAFYRYRLARCFLGATRRDKRDPQNFTGFDDKDDFKLSDLVFPKTVENQKGEPKLFGPLHIINCALNLGGSKDLSLHTRHSAIFTLTPLFCGSSYILKDHGVEIGYVPTGEYGGKSGQPSLGQAIAVSGAAASPNMGYHTSPVTAFLLTLFNVRLGWWFPNPHNPDAIGKPSPLFSLRYLILELFGLAKEHCNYLSISDGGHFENLAAYELVKRQCKVIIISDGECDSEYQFEGLATLIRMCEVDFGVQIKIDLRSIDPEKDSFWSRSRCAVGKIIYSDKSEGTLIYIKASMNGLEDTAVLQYRAAHQDFPHESTGDQFYSEDQFESYRSLGRDITERTFAPVMRKVDPGTRLYTEDLFTKGSKERDLIECAEQLQSIWSPELPTIGQFSRHADRLMALWSEIREDESLKSLDNQLTNDAYKSADEKSRSEFYFCSELIQQMENVYLDLNLEETWGHPDNEGWRTLFIRWANSEALKKIWEATDTNYGLRFRYFCERHLRLPFSGSTHKE